MTDDELLEELQGLQNSYSFTQVGHCVLDNALNTLLLVKKIREEKPEC